MQKELSLKKITELWQNTSFGTNFYENGTELSDTTFNLSIDENGRGFFFFTDKKGLRLGTDEILSDGTPLGLAISRLKNQSANRISWESDEDSAIYLDENSEFTYQLFKGERSFLFNGSIISNAMENERSRIALNVGETEDKKITLSLELHTENEVLGSPLPLTQNYAVCEGKIYKTRDTGINYNSLSFFTGQTDKEELTQYLSLFASIFPNLEIRMEGWSTPAQNSPTSYAEPALNFRGLDEDGNLAVRLLWCHDPYPTEFISENKPSFLVKLNHETRTIERTPLSYGGSENWNKLGSILKSCVKSHPECRENDDAAFTIDGDTLYITSSLALPFLTENLSELAENYRLFGTDALGKYKLKTVQPKTHLKIGSGIDFFDTRCEIEIDGEFLSPDKLVSLYEKNKFIPLSDGSRAIIDKAFFSRLKRLLGKQQKDGSYRISFFDMPLVDSLINAKIEGAAKTPWREFFSSFNTIQDMKLKDIPVVKKLRDYQKYGVQWLRYLMEHNLGGCLADDMGLGKTIQTISVLALAYEEDGEKGSSIIIVPKSLIDNWISEISRFAPGLDAYAYYGPERDIKEAMRHKIVLTTYAVARNDIETLQKEKFEYAVLDEVQSIKNTSSQSSKAVMLLDAKHRMALSGTPMENNLGELYSIFRFLNPAMFGTEGDFNRRYGTPIQKDGDEDAAMELGAKIRPFILRRLKQDVAKELPERTEQMIYVDMGQEQAALYERQRIFYQKLIAGEIAKNGFEKSQFSILQALLELRQIATVPETKTEGSVESAKWETLCDTISELTSSGHRCLVFSNFLASIDAVSTRLENSGTKHLVMTGATTDRQNLVRKFQQDETYKVFLMTLKTGGVGLNLTGADYVFILDPWWNRSAEQQAIDRTHRIGQTRNVFCYRLIARNTIEEKILELQKKKQDLFSAVISSDGQQVKKLTEEDIDYLLRG